MTDNRMALLEMAEKGGDVDFLRELVREVVHELMEAEVSQHCGAQRHERSEQRQDQRNGYRTRRWDTRLGSMELQVPRLRHANYLPSFPLTGGLVGCMTKTSAPLTVSSIFTDISPSLNRPISDETNSVPR